ncbi:hypothetical protein HMN09_00732100 [Mycena chlorophos]|uniref:Uncharacterized protein n=1 Tax=Mycena chlorophos TaxID=658473 RepID=A0A8H6SV06_MYCCL|nr:hypothetical protein HMN09_00732100 [Mycena chlorophos]
MLVDAVPAASSTTTTQSSPSVAPVDLRHMTSNSALVVDARRASQHLQASARKGSRSPTSIPSSPTSVHSSSSAIFERDIEPIHLSPSTFGAKKDPHRIPRAKNTESIEQSVPSVLDSAASILTSIDTDDGDSVSVIAPAAPLLLDQAVMGRSRSSASGFASPIGFRSRSPSPSPRPNRNSLLLSLPPVHTPVASPPGSSSPNTSPIPLTARQLVVDAATVATPTSNKRLSFISYTDLLSSTPTATQPLSALTSPASSPGHIPGVALAESIKATGPSSAYGGSAAPSLRNFALGDEDRTADDVGGEWERSGLGRGLEERLEALQSVGMA